MANLNPLIRLRKYKVEEKQKVLGELFREAERIEGDIILLRQRLEKEKTLAEQSNDYETVTAFGLFAERVRGQTELLNQQLAKVNARIVVAQDAMREAFGELKKIQIIQKNRDDEDDRREARKESKTMDEIGVQGYARSQTEE